MADEHSRDLRTRPAVSASTDPLTESAKMEADIIFRAKWARSHNRDDPHDAWSVEEQLGVALALHNREHLAALGFTEQEALARIAATMQFPPDDMGAWFARVRGQIGQH
ncbi:hypothetical protein [Micromonospora aurantiaca (nom. illeg.)]|uniref:hypothetical protein n=1 Tax=Micromonospora aurantiaca (nom. illeg.) TaxID=47850 RepID=UPI0033FB3EA5